MLPKNSSKLNFSKKPFLVVDLYFVVVCKVYVKDFFPTFSKNFPLTIVNRYTVRKSFPESNAFQYSERTMATIETNITSTKSPLFQLLNNTLKVLVSLKLTSGEVIEGMKSKTVRAHIKFNKICFSRPEGVAASW